LERDNLYDYYNQMDVKGKKKEKRKIEIEHRCLIHFLRVLQGLRKHEKNF